MCHHEKQFYSGTGQAGCFCQGKTGIPFMSKKMKIQALKKHLAAWEERTEDIKAYIQELEEDN